MGSRVRQEGGMLRLPIVSFPAVRTEETFHAQGFHCGHWSQVSFSRCLLHKRQSRSHTSPDHYMPLRVCFSMFFLLSGVVLCTENCLLRSTEKETARQRQYHFTQTNKAKVVAAASPQFFTLFIFAPKYLASRQIFSASRISKCHCSEHGTQYSVY